MILAYNGREPEIGGGVYIAPSADIIGDVVIGDHSSVWFGVVIRGDVHYIRVGARTNIQDGSVLHVMRTTHPLVLGDDVTVGHGCVLHGCSVESRCLIGMGSTILNGARIGPCSIIAAGSVVTEGTVVPPNSLFMGVPARFRRHLTAEDLAEIDRYAANYVAYKESYLGAGQARVAVDREAAPRAEAKP